MSFPMRKLVSLAAVFGLGLAGSASLFPSALIAKTEAPFPASPQPRPHQGSSKGGRAYLVMMMVQWMKNSPYQRGSAASAVVPMLTMEGCEQERLRMQSKQGYSWEDIGIDSVCIEEK